MKMKSLCIAVSAALLMGTATLSTAASVEGVKNSTENAVDNTIDKLPPKRAMTRAEYASEKAGIESGYKSAHAACKPLAGNTKDVCQVEAKSDEKMKLADLEARYKATPSADYDARVARAKAQYEVAKQKCEDEPSGENGICKTNAKADESRALSDAKAAKTASNN